MLHAGLQQTNPSYGLYTISDTGEQSVAGHQPAEENAYSDVHFSSRVEDESPDVYVPVLPDATRVPSVRADVQSGRHNTDCKFIFSAAADVTAVESSSHSLYIFLL